MAILVSPGVDLQVIDESFYGSSGPGTVPLIVIATESNKPTPSGDGIAMGTLPENAGRLHVVTSQRELLQSFGDPVFHTLQGTPLQGYELNEYGLLAAYSYLGIANRAFILRADVPLNELEAQVFEPRSAARSGTYWLDLSNTAWGLFVSNGQTAPGLAWDSETPFVINNRTETETMVFGDAAFADETETVFSAEASITINSVDVDFTASMSLQDVADQINNTPDLIDVQAGIYRLSGNSFLLIKNRTGGQLSITGTGVVELGLETPVLQIPKQSLGLVGELAVVTLDNTNAVYQKLLPRDQNGDPDAKAVPLWLWVGSDSWKAADPSVLSSSTNPAVADLQSGDELTISDGNLSVTFTVGSATYANLNDLVGDLNTALLAEDDLPIMAFVKGSQVALVNYNGGDVILTEDAGNTTPGILSVLGMEPNSFGKKVVYASHVQVPTSNNVGDVWIKTTTPNYGASYDVKVYNAETGQWSVIPAPLYSNDDAATLALGLNAVAGTLYTNYNVFGTASSPLVSSVIKRYMGANPVVVEGSLVPGSGSNTAMTMGDKFVITASRPSANSTSVLSSTSVVTIGQFSGGNTLNDVVSDINAAGIPGISATVGVQGIVISNAYGMSVQVSYYDPNTDTDVSDTNSGDPLAEMGVVPGVYSNWVALDYESNTVEPTSEAAEGTLWYNDDFQVDIMVADGDEWIAYRNMFPTTNPTGPMLAGSPPLTQLDGTPLVENDLWIDTTDLENYPKIYRWRAATLNWELVDNTDQTTPFGIVFADARWNADGSVDGSRLASDMLVSNYLDPDAPDPRTYPAGTLLFNTRYSTYNVKEWRPNHFAEYIGYEDDPGVQYRVGIAEFDADTITGANAGRWVTVSGNKLDGAPYMGRNAQRIMVVRALAEAVMANEEVRSDGVYFNLMAAPGYPELLDELVNLNVDKREVAFIVGDTPARLSPAGTDLAAWASNAYNAPSTGDLGLTTRNTYVGIYYPWALSTDLNGNEVMVPPSSVALRTYAYNDSVAYPWFAPAGTQRGQVSNAASVGFLNSEDEYQPIYLNQGQRDILYENNINPITFMPGRGLLVIGQKTLHPVESALDRVNVARLINFLRYNLDLLAKPFLFEPNDKQTRDQVKATFDRWMGNLVSLRALYDHAIICDESNNTPDRIDRNELWIDVLIQPVKSIEFIYIPIRIRNTDGDMSL